MWPRGTKKNEEEDDASAAAGLDPLSFKWRYDSEDEWRADLSSAGEDRSALGPGKIHAPGGIGHSENISPPPFAFHSVFRMAAERSRKKNRGRVASISRGAAAGNNSSGRGGGGPSAPTYRFEFPRAIQIQQPPGS